jgi:hypothetical protein
MNILFSRIKTTFQKYFSLIDSFLIYKSLVLLCALYFILIVFYIVLSRINYPFELEWMEGGSLLQVVRILARQPLYVKPSLEYIPYIYPPLYFYISSLFSILMGISFLPLRVVSFLSSVGCISLIFMFVFRETRDWFSGLIAIGFFAATFRLSGAWFDVARVDSLFLFFILWAVYIIHDHDLKNIFIGSILFSCAFFTKQTGIFVILIMLIYSIIINLKTGLKLATLTFIWIGGISLLWNYFSDGWFKFYVFDLARSHTLSFNFEAISKLKVFKPTMLAIIIGSFFLERIKIFPFSIKLINENRSKLYIPFIITALIGISWIGKVNPGGYDNVLEPGYASIAILFGLGLSEAFKIIKDNKLYFLNIVLAFLIIYQFYLLHFPISPQIPTKQDRLAGEYILGIIRKSKGEVFIPASNYLAYLAGKGTYFNSMSMGELDGRFGQPVTNFSQSVWNEFDKAISEETFSMIILDKKSRIDPIIFGSYYLFDHEIFTNPDDFIPVTGSDNRPESLYSAAP